MSGTAKLSTVSPGPPRNGKGPGLFCVRTGWPRCGGRRQIRLAGAPTIVTVFTAPWYPGHDRLVGIVDEVSEWAGSDRIRLVDVDDEFAEAEKRLVLALPTAVATRGDSEVKRIVGAVDADDLKGLISRNKRRPAR